MSLLKLAIESGPHSNLPNAWKVKKGMGPNSNVPLATGLMKQALEIPISHLKGDTKEINEIRGLAKKIIKITRGMNAEDAKAMNKVAYSTRAKLDKKWSKFMKERDDNYYEPLYKERDKINYDNKTNNAFKIGGSLGIGAGIGVGLALSRKSPLHTKIFKSTIHGAAGGLTLGLANFIRKGKSLDKKVELANPHFNKLRKEYWDKESMLEKEYDNLPDSKY